MQTTWTCANFPNMALFEMSTMRKSGPRSLDTGKESREGYKQSKAVSPRHFYELPYRRMAE